jgi:hypothetical protein
LSLWRGAVSSAPVRDKRELWLPVALMVAFALTRLPGMLPQNFSAAYALAFCAGVYLPRRMAWWLPLGVLLVTDVALNVFIYQTQPFGAGMLGNYVCYAGIIWLGQRFSTRSSWLGLMGGGLLGAVVFYLVTNTLSWLSDPAYLKTLAGWVQALTTGRPGFPPTWTFFWRTLASGGLFAGLFAGAMKMAEQVEPEAEEEAEPAAEDADASEVEEGKA